MLETTLDNVWGEFEITLFFECNAKTHFEIARGIKVGFFEQEVDKIKKTYDIIKENLELALTSSNDYIRRFAEIIYQNLSQPQLH
jgi:hypothetical protein